MKKILLAFALLLGILGAGIALATPLENNYPVIGNATAPDSSKADVPTFVRYIFNFALIAAAFIAFGALVYGGIKYLTSSGNAGKTGDAKEIIFAAFLGLGVLLFSWIFLDTINPNLTKIELPALRSSGGVKATFDDGAVIVYSSSVGNIDKTVTKLEFTPEDYEVVSYSSPYWQSGEQTRTPGSVSDPIKSLKIVSKIPGVYLCYDDSSQEICENYTYSAPSFGDLNGKFTKIKILDEADAHNNITKRFVAMVFEKENYGFGGTEIYQNSVLPTQFIGPTLNDNDIKTFGGQTVALKDNWASSIKVFYFPEATTPPPGKVTLWSAANFSGDKQEITNVPNKGDIQSNLKDETRSVDIQGQRIITLCENACDTSGSTSEVDVIKCSDGNRCQAFFSSDADLTNDSIGTCRIAIVPNFSFSWLKRYPCAKYYIVKFYSKQ